VVGFTAMAAGSGSSRMRQAAKRRSCVCHRRQGHALAHRRGVEGAAAASRSILLFCIRGGRGKQVLEELRGGAELLMLLVQEKLACTPLC
jgi:hypothetical protein